MWLVSGTLNIDPENHPFLVETHLPTPICQGLSWWRFQLLHPSVTWNKVTSACLLTAAWPYHKGCMSGSCLKLSKFHNVLRITTGEKWGFPTNGGTPKSSTVVWDCPFLTIQPLGYPHDCGNTQSGIQKNSPCLFRNSHLQHDYLLTLLCCSSVKVFV